MGSISTTNNNQITITAYTGPNGAVTILDTINGLPVTTIAFQAFVGKGIISVILPSGLTLWAMRRLTPATACPQ